MLAAAAPAEQRAMLAQLLVEQLKAAALALGTPWLRPPF
jgi:hypothetical protein